MRFSSPFDPVTAGGSGRDPALCGMSYRKGEGAARFPGADDPSSAQKSRRQVDAGRRPCIARKQLALELVLAARLLLHRTAGFLAILLHPFAGQLPLLHLVQEAIEVELEVIDDVHVLVSSFLCS
jgi:hypothetical protein